MSLNADLGKSNWIADSNKFLAAKFLETPGCSWFIVLPLVFSFILLLISSAIDYSNNAIEALDRFEALGRFKALGRLKHQVSKASNCSKSIASPYRQ